MMLRTKRGVERSTKCLKCNMCKNDDGYIGWRDDSETKSSLVCSSCGFVHKEFTMEFIEETKTFRTDDLLINLLVYNVRVKDIIDMVHIDGDYQIPPEVALRSQLR